MVTHKTMLPVSKDRMNKLQAVLLLSCQKQWLLHLKYIT